MTIEKVLEEFNLQDFNYVDKKLLLLALQPGTRLDIWTKIFWEEGRTEIKYEAPDMWLRNLQSHR